MLRNCLYCQVPFEPKKPKQKFCSDKHRVYYNRQQSKPVSFPPPEAETPKKVKKKAISVDQPPPGLIGIDLAIWKAQQKEKQKS